MGPFARRIVLVLVLLGVVFSAVSVWAYAQFVRPGPLAAAQTVIISRGAGLDDIAAQLTAAGVLPGPQVFRVGAWLSGRDKSLRAGEYAFAARISPRQVVALLQSGKTVVRRLTVAEGLTTAQVLAQLNRTEGLEGDLRSAPGEGTLLPETYHFSYGERRDAMVTRMRAAMDETLARLWDSRAPGVLLKSPREALILASIVEKETALPEERSRIAAVFLNRLGKGMRLQSGSDGGLRLDRRTGAAGPATEPRRPENALAVQHLSDRRPSPRSGVQSGPGGDGGGSRSDRHQGFLFRRRRHRWARLRPHPRRAQSQCGPLAQIPQESTHDRAMRGSESRPSQVPPPATETRAFQD